MRLVDVVRQLWSDLSAQRLRTILTVLGITWGTVAVVVLLAFSVGLERQTIKRFHGLGDRIVVLFGGRTVLAHAGFREGRTIRLRETGGIRKSGAASYSSATRSLVSCLATWIPSATRFGSGILPSP